MAEYTAHDIKALTAIEAIRLRPGMYLGRMNLQGFAHLIQEFISYVFDHLECEQFHLQLKEDLSGKLVFNQIKKTIPYRVDEGIWSPGLAGMDAALTLNATCAQYTSKMYLNDELVLSKRFRKGESIQGEENVHRKVITDCWEIDFKLDPEIWLEIDTWNPDFISQELKDMAFLNKGRKFLLEYEVEGETSSVRYCFKNGLADKLKLIQLNGIGNSIFESYEEKTFEGFKVEVAFAFRNYNVDSSSIQSYSNYDQTIEHGTHLQGLLKGLTYGVMKYFQKQGFTTEYKISQKGIRENLIAIIHIQIDRPNYSGCVKNKLANPEVIQPIKEWIADVLFLKMENDQEATASLIRKFKI